MNGLIRVVWESGYSEHTFCVQIKCDILSTFTEEQFTDYSSDNGTEHNKLRNAQNEYKDILTLIISGEK